MTGRDLQEAARLGEPSYIWRAGQERRFELIREAAGERLYEKVLDNGCGIGSYLERLSAFARIPTGIEYDLVRAASSRSRVPAVACAAGEALPFPDHSYDLVLSHEVLEHVQDDRRSLEEIIRVCRPGGRAVIFVPNRGYPFETHGIYWRGSYRFGNYPLVNYLPDALRSRFAPHVRSYTTSDLRDLTAGLPVRIVRHTILFAAYDNIIARWPTIGRSLRWLSRRLESTPLRAFGLSHFLVLEKEEPPPQRTPRSRRRADP